MLSNSAGGTAGHYIYLPWIIFGQHHLRTLETLVVVQRDIPTH